MNILIVVAIIIIVIMLIILIAYKPNKTLSGSGSKKYVIVGDIHGNKEQFNLMMSYINKGYTAIFMGDLTQEHNSSKHNMTDFSVEMYSLLKQGKLIWVCGNHDILQYYTTKIVSSRQEKHKNYPKIYTKAIEWAKKFPFRQKWFMKCFDEKLVKFKLLMDNNGNILPEEKTDVTRVDKYFENKLSLNDLIQSGDFSVINLRKTDLGKINKQVTETTGFSTNGVSTNGVSANGFSVTDFSVTDFSVTDFSVTDFSVTDLRKTGLDKINKQITETTGLDNINKQVTETTGFSTIDLRKTTNLDKINKQVTETTRNIKCFSHWVVNKLTPIKTTEEFYEMLKYIDNEHFDKWFELYDHIWIREDYPDQRIYAEHYVGHSNILMLIGRETIDPLIPEDVKIKTETLTYLMFKCFWPNEIQTKFLNKIATHKNIEFYEEKLKNINAETIIDEINTAGFYRLGSLHLCDVYPDRYELSKHVKMPESLPKIFELEFN